MALELLGSDQLTATERVVMNAPEKWDKPLLLFAFLHFYYLSMPVFENDNFIFHGYNKESRHVRPQKLYKIEILKQHSVTGA